MHKAKSSLRVYTRIHARSQKQFLIKLFVSTFFSKLICFHRIFQYKIIAPPTVTNISSTNNKKWRRWGSQQLKSVSQPRSGSPTIAQVKSRIINNFSCNKLKSRREYGRRRKSSRKKENISYFSLTVQVRSSFCAA